MRDFYQILIIIKKKFKKCLRRLFNNQILVNCVEFLKFDDL